ncbi:MAG: GSCFA domain-containing protein [Devosia sp.]
MANGAEATPYAALGPTAFWRSGVADRGPFGLRDICVPRFPVDPSMGIATQGSCFAQHIGRELTQRGFRWLQAEPPIDAFSKAVNAAHNYGVFTFRTGNIYTPRLLAQWLEWAASEAPPPQEVWQNGARFVDPFRPTIDPEGFASEAAVLAARNATLQAIASILPEIDVFIFTLGQTEAWQSEDGTTYPLCPGTAGGTFDGARHRFVNFDVLTCVDDMERARRQLKRHNAAMKILLTVSPVPMVATASGEHVMVANARTKSVLRSTADALCTRHDDIDYFPSYELITQPPMRAMFYDPNLRTVCRDGVRFVMGHFFTAHGIGPKPSRAAKPPKAAAPTPQATEEDVVCEEVLLEAAAPA